MHGACGSYVRVSRILQFQHYLSLTFSTVPKSKDNVIAVLSLSQRGDEQPLRGLNRKPVIIFYRLARLRTLGTVGHHKGADCAAVHYAVDWRVLVHT